MIIYLIPWMFFPEGQLRRETQTMIIYLNSRVLSQFERDVGQSSARRLKTTHDQDQSLHRNFIL